MTAASNTTQHYMSQAAKQQAARQPGSHPTFAGSNHEPMQCAGCTELVVEI
jgi:hypothetical protein